MFSGIVERTAEVVSIRTDRQNKDFTLRADFCKELKIDQSIAHNGVCLTVVDITEDTYTVTAMKETLDRSNLGLLREGDLVNLERSIQRNNIGVIEKITLKPWMFNLGIASRFSGYYRSLMICNE
mgnify:CR=1 FL=1